MAVAAYTGARRGEIRGMRWENLHDGAIYIEGSVWQSHELDPKTRASKAPIPIIPALASMLARHRALIGSPSSGPMFPCSSGKPICLNNVVNRVILPALNWCAICRKAETAHKNTDHNFKRDDNVPQWHGWHAFRRGLATNLYRLRVPDKVIQAILRHADVRTTMNVYVKTVSVDAVNAMLALDSAPLCSDCAPEAPNDGKARVN